MGINTIKTLNKIHDAIGQVPKLPPQSMKLGDVGMFDKNKGVHIDTSLENGWKKNTQVHNRWVRVYHGVRVDGSGNISVGTSNPEFDITNFNGELKIKSNQKRSFVFEAKLGKQTAIKDKNKIKRTLRNRIESDDLITKNHFAVTQLTGIKEGGLIQNSGSGTEFELELSGDIKAGEIADIAKGNVGGLRTSSQQNVTTIELDGGHLFNAVRDPKSRAETFIRNRVKGEVNIKYSNTLIEGPLIELAEKIARTAAISINELSHLIQDEVQPTEIEEIAVEENTEK